LIDHHLSAHCDAEVVASPDEAIVLATEHQFDVLVLDIHLSASADGIELLHHLRTMPGYAHAPAIALTAYAMPSDRDQFLDAGFDFHLSKPFTKEQLVETLNHAWGHSSAMPPS
jgi:CheY-like chemotaxis protein